MQSAPHQPRQPASVQARQRPLHPDHDRRGSNRAALRQALLDANVLYPVPLRDLLLQLTTAKVFRARWTSAIHKEWIRAATANRPDIDPAKWTLLRNLMNAPAEDCLITGYEPLIDVVTLPDPNDRHVMAAAIKGRADVIVTFNLKDYPADVLETYDLEAQHPDVFLRHLIDLSPS